MSTIEQGRILGGKYRLDERLAGGGMGSIWRGWDLRLEAPVAVKFMRQELAEKGPQRARFEREAKAAAKIRSPHVVHIYDHGVDGDTPYIVMELLEGEDLGQRLKRAGQLGVAEAVRIATDICRGLHRAHRRNIVHRDLKPGNVFLSAPDDDLVKILDFGIAKAREIKTLGSEATTTGQLLGSPQYMSPEQARGMPLDGRSDLWSLGVILYRGLTSHYPFRGVEIGDLIVRICTDDVLPPSRHRPGLGEAIDRFFARAFEKDPERRFQTAKEFAAAFAEAAQGSMSEGASARSGAAPSEPSWDSTGSAPAVIGEIATGDSGAASASRAPVAHDSGCQAPMLEPTPTGPSGTLGSVLAEPRPLRRRWRYWPVGAAFLAAGAAVAFVALRGPGGETPAPGSLSPVPSAPTGSAPTPPMASAARAAPRPPSPSATSADVDVDASAPLPAPASAPRPTATVAAPRPPGPTRPGPAPPRPTSSNTAPGYKPSDLGY